MIQNFQVFQKNKELFFEQLASFWSNSPDYANMVNDLDEILVLADRILVACQEDLEFNRVIHIAEYLDELSKRVKTDKIAENILEDMELWLRAILNFAKPNLWQIRRHDSHYTLAPLMREDLNLLSQVEISLDVDSYHQIISPVNQLIFLAYRYRNPLTHSPRDYPDLIKARFLPAGLCTLISPVYIYKKQIKEVLNNLIVSPFNTPNQISILTLVNSERQKHIMGFRGRERWLNELSQKLLLSSNSPKPYVLLNGHEGMGKSALVAKLTEDLSTNTPAIGRYAGLVKKTAPWLPNLIIHFGKQSNHPHEIVDLLLAQINTLLLEPIEIEQVRISLKDFLPKDTSRSSYLRADGESHYVTEKPFSSVFHQGIEETIKTEAYDFKLYRRVLYIALEQVVKEKGNIIFILDAVDEISLDGSELEFLPDILPVGVSAILSARESKIVKWLKDNRDVEVIRLKELEKSEIPLFTDVKNEDGEIQARFNERVWKASGGWPLMVLEASKLAHDNPNDLDRIQIDRSKDGLFERRVNEWKLATIKSVPNALIDILKMLSIFEPVSAIDLDLIQAFLERNDIKVSRDEIKVGLHQVSSQIEGLDANRIKLALKAFAEYIRERWLGKKDLVRTLDELVEWLAKKRI